MPQEEVLAEPEETVEEKARSSGLGGFAGFVEGLQEFGVSKVRSVLQGFVAFGVWGSAV